MIVNRPNRWRTWGEIVRLGKLNLWLILLVNIGLFCSVTGILVWGIGDVIRLHGFRNNGQLIIQLLLLLLPLRLLLPNTVKLFLFLVGRGYQMIK